MQVTVHVCIFGLSFRVFLYFKIICSTITLASPADSSAPAPVALALRVFIFFCSSRTFLLNISHTFPTSCKSFVHTHTYTGTMWGKAYACVSICMYVYHTEAAAMRRVITKFDCCNFSFKLMKYGSRICSLGHYRDNSNHILFVFVIIFLAKV